MNSQHWIKTLLLALPLTLLAACSAPQKQVRPPVLSPIETSERTPEQLVAEANRSREPRRSQLYLLAAGPLIDTQTEYSLDLLHLINPQQFNLEESNTYKLLNAQASLKIRQAILAGEWLDSLDLTQLQGEERILHDTFRAQLANLEGRYAEAIQYWGSIITWPNVGPEVYQQLWISLVNAHKDEFERLTATNTNPDLLPWIELAIIYRKPAELSQQLAELNRWQQRWQGASVNAHLPEAIHILQTLPPYNPARIAVLLPLSGPQATVGSAVRDGLLTGYYHSMNNSTPGSTIPELMFYDTEGEDPAALMAQVQEEGAEMIIGPLRRSFATAALQNRGESEVKVPWLILNQVSEAGFDSPIYQFGLASESEAESAARRAWQDGYQHPVIIAVNGDWGARVAKSFQMEWEKLGGKTLDTYTYESNGDYNTAVSEALLVNSSIKRANSLSRLFGEKVEYTPRRREDADMIFVVGSPSQGRQLKPALDFYFAYNLPVYTVSNMYSGQTDQTQDRDLDDIRIPVMPWLVEKSPFRSSIQKNWRDSPSSLAPLYALGVDAWRIYPRLEQMAQSGSAQILGSTGVLTIPFHREVRRELNWQYFINGRLSPLTLKASRNPNYTPHVLENKSHQ